MRRCIWLFSSIDCVMQNAAGVVGVYKVSLGSLEWSKPYAQSFDLSNDLVLKFKADVFNVLITKLGIGTTRCCFKQ